MAYSRELFYRAVTLFSLCTVQKLFFGVDQELVFGPLLIFFSCCLLLADEDHFNSNVQLRRTARHDVGIAQKLQDEEVEVYQREDAKRKQEMRQK